jgi:3-hydroxybutyryl-CoA dehydrogenase
MGVGIAYVYAVAGWTTWVVEPDEARTRAMQRTLAQAAESGLRRGKLTAVQAEQLGRAVQRLASVAELPLGLDLVVETVPERLALKQQVLTDIEVRSPRVIASNTSALSIDILAGSLRDPGLFLGMHFFNPVWSLPMVELVRGSLTRPDILALARGFAEATGKVTITDDIDRAMVVAYRHPVGPLRLSDMVGLDVRLDIARHLSVALGDRYAPPRLLEDMVACGQLGQKSGKGFFEWPSAEA